MQQQITRGDYLEDLITIYIENNLQQNLEDLYSMFVFQCGEIQKQLTPAPVIKISFTEAESKLLTNYNTCYLAGITKDGHKETFNGSISFNTRGEVVYYEPTPNSSLQASTTSTIACPCTGISGVFANCTQPAIKAYFSINYVPTKLSELTNDTDFQDGVDVAESISIHNASTEAHPYIQSVMASTTEALSVSIQAEETAREQAVSLAISTTEAYTDSVVTQATEATKAYADSIVSTATTATEAYTDSVLQSATTAINTTIGDLSQLDTSVKSSVTNAINSEVSARQSADNNLQGQIDALAAASDVTDIVGTYQELQNYDTQHLNNNDIIKVLSDETHDDEPSYYRFNKTAGTFSYIGSESAAYTKAQSNSIFVAQTTTVNNKPLSSDITLTHSDVNALSDTYATTIAGNTSAIASNTSAIASNTSVIASHTTAIASNTSDISTINGKIPTDASSSNKLVSASTLAASIADFANQNLSNLTATGEARLHALKSYADKGELLTDAEGLADIKSYAHSTFDASKFTKVGSPIVTTDGIASGFGGSNNLTYPIFDVTKKWELRETIYYNQTTERIYSFGGDNWAVLKNNGDIRVIFSYPDIKDLTIPNWTKLTETNWYDIRISYDGSQTYNFKSRVHGTNSWTNNVNYNAGNYRISKSGDVGIIGDSYSILKGIDLKQFSITVDGVEVFSGNKTGIDTIKPVDFTAITSSSSSPFVNPSLPFSDSGLTITTDGILTVASGNSRVKSSVAFANASSWEIDAQFTSDNNLSTVQPLITSNSIGIYLHLNNNALALLLSSTSNPNGDICSLSTIINKNTAYWIKIIFTGSKYQFLISLDGKNYSDAATPVDSITKVYGFSYLEIGARAGSATGHIAGSIDLNAFKIYVDGDLVYQPCLKIPYTESKTGSKVVNAPYRDRVNDMAEQFGYANYYTLSDTDFTLPQVELYGLIGQRTLRDSYRNGINYWELYSNRDLEQGGSCTSGVEVTFARPFADTNYVLSVPYSAKSATAFTPTQTGDWIAKGKGLL